MTASKQIAKILSYISWLLAFFYLGVSFYGAICLLTGWNIGEYGDGKFMHIFYPFTKRPFLNFDNNASYIIFSFLMPITLYGIFFWYTASVFTVFSKPKLFTQPNLVHLKRYYLLNLLGPGVAAILASFFVEVESVLWALVLVHFILGIFAWFLAEIFKQGLQLQHEQDLFI